MPSLRHCLRKIGLEQHEVAILRGSAAELTAEGYAAKEAAETAVLDYISALDQERADIARQVREAGGAMPEDTVIADKETVATRDTFTRENIKNIVNLDGWAILTAENPGGVATEEDFDANDRANARRTDELRRYLDEQRIDYMEIRGRYSSPEQPEERSFVVFTDRDRALAIGARFGQDSILTRNGLEYMDGRRDKATGEVEVFSKVPENYYSRVLGADWGFQVGIDFGPAALPSIDNESEINDHGVRWEDAERAIGMRIPVPLRNVSAARRLFFGGDFGLRGQKQGETGKMRVSEVAGLAYRRATRAFRGQAKGEFNDANAEFISRVLAADALLELKLNPDKNGAQWYRETMERAVDEAAALYPEIAEPNGRLMFTLALAITSNGTSIAENVKYAFQQYEKFRRAGRFPTSFEFGGERGGTMRQQFRMANDLLVRFRGNENALREYVFTKVPARDVMSEFGVVDEDTGAVLRKKNVPELVDEMIYRSTAFGPKVGGAFWPSLNGIGDVVTMDRWFMRTWGRISGTGLKTNEDGSLALDKKGYAQMVEAPRGGGQRSFIRRVMGMAAARVNEHGYDLRPTDLQALLWYVEKRYYQSFGAADARGAPTDYDTEVREYVKQKRKRTQGGRADRAGPGRGVAVPVQPAQPGLFGSLPEFTEPDVRPGREGSVSVVGFHYGAAPGLTRLSGAAFGRQTRGAERRRLDESNDPRLKKRVYFHVITPGQTSLPMREQGLGPNAYVSRLTNLYESGVSPRLTYDPGMDERDRANNFESALLDAGYDGYVVRRPDIAVILNKDVPVRAIGNIADGINIPETDADIPTLGAADPNVLASIEDIDSFDGMDEEYADATDHRLEADIEAIGHPVYTDQLAEEVRDDMARLQGERKYGIYEIARVGRDWLLMASNRANFTYPFSDSQDLAAVAKAMSGGAVSVEPVKPDALAQSILREPGTRAMLAEMGVPRGKMVRQYNLKLRLTEKQAIEMGQKYAVAGVSELEGGFVFLNISLFESGVTQGNLIYQIVGTWAHNAGKKFVGDPVGLSERALFRRTENMLTNALRTGSTKHLIPHPYQRNAGMKWMAGDDEYNVGAMALWSRDAVELYTPTQWRVVTQAVAGERPAAMERKRPNVVSDAEGFALSGRRTTARAAITEAIQRGVQSGAAEFVEPGIAPNMEGRIEPKVIEGEILYSLPTTMDDVRILAHDFFKTEQKVGWWDKTIGTQYGKAQAHKDTFGKVYDRTQQFLNDISLFANEATEFAPGVLPKMEHWSDAIRGAGKDFTAGRRRDLRAASQALFDGTIEDKIWTDDELRARGLTNEQAGLYRQMRRAINVSLDQLAVSEMHRLTRNMGLDAARARMLGMQAGRARDFLLAEIAKLPRFSDAHQEALEFVRKELNEKANKVEGLKAIGYAPLMRFGKYAIEFTIDGERSFMMFESELDRNRFEREVVAEGATDINKGIMSARSWELFRGLDLNALELFGETATLDVLREDGTLGKVALNEEPMFQQYLKLAISSRSAMKRLIKRKKVAGYDKDGQRVLAQFVVSNARTASRNLHLADMVSDAGAIPREQGDLRDEAISLVRYIQDPIEEASKLRGFLFFHFLGGSIAAALVNMTQPIMMTFPFLSQFGTADAFSAMSRGLRQAFGRAPGGKLGADLKIAEEQGIVSPQEIHSLYAEASRSITGDIRVRRLLLLWGSMFSAAEQWNRRTTFIASWEIGNKMGQQKLESMGFASPFEFAVHAVAETQGTYNKGNRPNWARGAVGATIFTFKQYSIHYLEWFKRLPRKQQVMAMAMLVMVSGLNGLPFADDLDDLIDAMAQSLGYAWNTKDKKRELVASVIGKQGAEFVLSGLSTIPGMPLDVQGRLSMGNLIPGTGLFKRSATAPARDVFEILGPVGSLGQSVVEGGKELMAGNVSGAAQLASPIAIRNILKGQDILQTGAYRDMRGKKVIDADTTDAIVKIIGFQPSDVAKAQRAERSVQEMVTLARSVKADISERWAEGLYLKRPDVVQQAREELADWNAANPQFPLRIRFSDIARRAREKAKPRSERIAQAAPESIRQEVGRRLSE